MSIRATKPELEQLFKIVRLDQKRKARYLDKPHMWYKHKAQASEKMGLSRTTIDKYLDTYSAMPEKPKKTIPAYFVEWDETDCAKVVTNLYYDVKLKDLNKTGKRVYSILREAWKARGKKDPLTFDLQDFLYFFGSPENPPYADFVDPETGAVEFNTAVAVRVAMRQSKDSDIRGLIAAKDPRFQPVKREIGRKRHWYLGKDQIIRVSGCINEPDTLIFDYIGILTGSRGNATRKLKATDIHRAANTITVFEEKIAKRKGGLVDKKIFDFSMDLVMQYVMDFNLKGALFANSLQTYNNRLTQAGKEAEIEFEEPLTSHMLKHTCVTQMLLHDVPIDVVSEYTRTEPKTLMDFYRGGGEQRIDEHILCIAEKPINWLEWFKQIHPYFVDRYKRIKPLVQKVDGFKPIGA